MANSDKNIKITPNISQTSQPNVVYIGQGNIPITMKVLDDSYGTLSFEGSAGQLFSINNNLTSGIIYSVNDVSGLPQFDVNANGTIRMGPYGTGLYVGGLSGSTFTIQPSTRTSSGAGSSIAIIAGSGVTSGAGGSLILQAGLQATSGGDGKVVVKQVSGQTSNLQEWQNSSGSALASLDTTGRMTVPYLNATGGTYSASSPALVLNTGTGFYYSNPYIYFCAGNNSQIYMAPAGGQFIVNVNGQPGSTSGQILVKPGNGGGAQVNCLVVQQNPNQGSNNMFTVTGHGAMTITPDLPSVSCATLNGSAAYTMTATTKALTANVATITVSGGTPKVDIGDTIVVALSPSDAVFDGTYTISAKSGNNLSYARTNTDVASTATGGTVSSTATATLQNINIGVPGAKGLVIKAAASQTANLQEWQNSSGTAVAFADSIGDIGARSFFLNTNGDIRGPYLFGDNNPTFVLSAANPAFLQLGSNGYIGWTSSANNANAAADTSVYKDAAGVLAQRNGTNAQTFRVYNTFTSSTAYERLGISWASNICTIGVEQAGGGVQRVLNVNANNINAPTLPASATVTAATGNGTTATYTAANTFSVGQVVSITGLTTTIGSSLNLSNQTITTASATQFTITNATVGTAAATQAGTATIQSAGNSITITAGNGSGVGAGGNIILQPGAQGSSGGNGWVKFYDVTGANTRMGAWNNSTQGYGFGWDTQNNGTLGTGLVSSSVNGTGYIGVKSQTTNHFMIETNNGTTALLTNSANTQSRLIFVNGNNAQTTSGSAGICSYTTGVITIRDGGTSIAGGSLSFPSSTTAFSANTNDLALTASAFQRINCTVAASLTGIAPPSGGTHVDGRMIRIYNVGTANLTLSHNSASSTAANRIFCATGSNIVLASNDYAELIYDATDNGSGAAGWRAA